MNKVWDLVKESVIVQGALTLGTTAFVFVLLYKEIAVPDNLWTLLGLAWGFYFGTKGQQVVNRIITK